jgi:hypothetical protein
MTTPRICFGQQPCGFFPKRFLFAKIATARRLQAELGGEIVFFYHDSDHDPRETTTILHYLRTGEAARLNFAFANKIQRKWSPLYLKRVLPDWHASMARQLPAFVDKRWVAAFKHIALTNVADFCLEMYRAMGLLENIRVVRSSDPAARRAACEVEDFFVDTPFQGEIARARAVAGALQLHQGGGCHLTLPLVDLTKEQVSPARDTRLRWMQSVVRCTHYVAGLGEQAYLNRADTPGVTFINRDEIERSDEAYTDIENKA